MRARPSGRRSTRSWARGGQSTSRKAPRGGRGRARHRGSRQDEALQRGAECRRRENYDVVIFARPYFPPNKQGNIRKPPRRANPPGSFRAEHGFRTGLKILGVRTSGPRASARARPLRTPRRIRPSPRRCRSTSLRRHRSRTAAYCSHRHRRPRSVDRSALTYALTLRPFRGACRAPRTAPARGRTSDVNEHLRSRSSGGCWSLSTGSDEARARRPLPLLRSSPASELAAIRTSGRHRRVPPTHTG